MWLIGVWITVPLVSLEQATVGVLITVPLVSLEQATVGVLITVPLVSLEQATVGVLITVPLVSLEQATVGPQAQHPTTEPLIFRIFLIKVSKGAKIRNRYNQVPHLTQNTNGKVTNSQ